MPSTPTLRPERPADHAAVAALVQAAFRGMPHSAGTEARIVEDLRQAHALHVARVAEADGALVGHIAFSAVTVGESPGRWFGLGPLSVLPAWQRRGIGSALVQDGLAALRSEGAAGCVLVGDAGYYRRFGFMAREGLHFDGVPDEHVLALSFGGSTPAGAIAYHPAFDTAP